MPSLEPPRIRNIRTVRFFPFPDIEYEALTESQVKVDNTTTGIAAHRLLLFELG
jgi:hypothetical protein